MKLAKKRTARYFLDRPKKLRWKPGWRGGHVHHPLVGDRFSSAQAPLLEPSQSLGVWVIAMQTTQVLTRLMVMAPQASPWLLSNLVATRSMQRPSVGMILEISPAKSPSTQVADDPRSISSSRCSRTNTASSRSIDYHENDVQVNQLIQEGDAPTADVFYS